jgi:nucleoside-diphosphate-sugar epimerase
MVIGNGMIANRFQSYREDNRFVIFASGISNSRNRDEAEYKREIGLLKDVAAANQDKMMVYFSTCSIYDPGEKDSRYVLHKLEIEDFIRSHCRHYNLFRVSHLAGQTNNRNTLLNFFIYHIKHKLNFDLWSNASRNLIDIDDMFVIVDTILQKQSNPGQVINIAGTENYRVGEIVAAIEIFFGTKANYITIEKGASFKIDIPLVYDIMKEITIQFGPDYLGHLLKKYYSG